MQIYSETNNNSLFINNSNKKNAEENTGSFDKVLNRTEKTEESIKNEEKENNTQSLIDEIKTLILSATRENKTEYVEKILEEIQYELNEKTPNKKKLKELAKELDHIIKQYKNEFIKNQEPAQTQNKNIENSFQPLNLQTTAFRSDIEYLEEILEELEDKIDNKTSPKEVLKELAKELETGMVKFKKEISGEITVDLSDDTEIDEKDRLKEEEKEREKHSYNSSDWLKSLEEFKKED